MDSDQMLDDELAGSVTGRCNTGRSFEESCVGISDSSWPNCRVDHLFTERCGRPRAEVFVKVSFARCCL